MFKLSRSEQLTVLFLVGVILVGGAVASVRKYLENKERGHLLTAESISSLEEEALPKEIIIHITGAVKRPGVYHFKEGARIIDAVKAAGGPEEDALLDILNLARPMEDGSKIVVSRKFDAQEFKKRLLSHGPEHVYTTEEIKLAYAKPGEEEKKEEAKEMKPKPGISEEGKVNINTASQSELETLPGIGPKIAGYIIEYRQSHGPFEDISEIKKVPKIGQGIYKGLKDKITVK